MSVDTHMKNKKTEAYDVVAVDDIELLVSPKLLEWAHSVEVDSGRNYLGRRSIKVSTVHDHGPGCHH